MALQKGAVFFSNMLTSTHRFKMESLVLLVMLSACAAAPQDMSEKLFVFPKATKTSYVDLRTTRKDFSALTVCHRSISDLRRDHALFSMATTASSNAFLIFWDNTNAEMEPHIVNQKTEFPGQDYKRNTWHSICTTWQSSNGIVQFWLDGRPSIKKAINTGLNLTGTIHTILGQEQDSVRGGFDINQSFVGMMTDVHIWDYVLSSCEIQHYVDEHNFTPGNVINWRALDYQITGQVLVDSKQMTCEGA